MRTAAGIISDEMSPIPILGLVRCWSPPWPITWDCRGRGCSGSRRGTIKIKVKNRSYPAIEEVQGSIRVTDLNYDAVDGLVTALRANRL